MDASVKKPTSKKFLRIKSLETRTGLINTTAVIASNRRATDKEHAVVDGRESVSAPSRRKRSNLAFKRRLPRRPLWGLLAIRGQLVYAMASSNSRGVVLLTTIILLLMLGSLGAALTGWIHSRLISTTLEVDRLQAVYLAEAGLAQALHEISNSRDLFGNDGIGVISPTSYGRGYFKVDHYPLAKSLVGIGLVGDIRRVIVSRYD